MKRLLGDLRSRRNLDVYVTIATAIVISVLSLFDVVPESKVTTLVLLVLAVVAYDSLATRDIVKSQHLLPAFPMYDDFAPDLIQNRNGSMDVYLIGVSLSRTIETSYSAFSRNLSTGARLRILLTDPEASEAAIDARCQASRPEIAEIRREIRSSLTTLARLNRVSPGGLEVRLTSAALKFGLNYLNTAMPSAVMHVQLYSYRLEGESRPMFILRPSDGVWFECFRTQSEQLWSDAEPVNLEDILTQ